jgi:membrane protease YdiL (CAAX protease family)
LRLAIVSADLEGIEAGSKRLDALQTQDTGLIADKQLLATIYEGNTDQLSTEDRERLIERHGYFGKLALSYGLPDTDALRNEVVGGGGLVITVLVLAGLLILGAFLAAIGCCIYGCIMLGERKIKPAFAAPLPGGSVFVETAAMLVGGFLFMIILTSFYDQIFTDPQTQLIAKLATQWLLLLTIFYPLLRGVPWSEYKRRIGLHAGKGVLREIRAGIFAYFALLPLFFVAVGIALVVMLVQGAIAQSSGESVAPPSNPVAELIGAGNPLVLFMFFTLATIWAPLVEEVIFRGALFRHMRARWGLWLSAAVSAIGFGVMHGYPVLLLLPVITLGFNFALMREWRDSLIAPITAHFMHNATLLTLAISLFSAAK